MRLRFPALVLAVVLVVGSMTSTLATSRGTEAATGGAYPVRGIDVSHWQGTITWSSVAADNVDFAILKATEGRTYVDPTFSTNAAGAELAGLHVGGYHVWSPSKSLDDARAEANHFVHVVHPGVGDVLPVLDMEMNRVPAGMKASTLEAWGRAWLNRVTQRTGVRPMVYGSISLFTDMLNDSTWFADHGFPLWIARWGPLPDPLPANDWQAEGWTFWQWTNEGHVHGISGGVDKDRYAGTNLQQALVAQLTAQPGTGGSITDATGKIDCAATLTCSALYSPGDPITFTATPDAGYSFVSWGGACASAGSTPTCSLTSLGNKTVSATFSYALKVKVAGAVRGTVVSSPAGIDCPGDCSAAYGPGTVDLTASTDQWAGVTWSGDCSGSDPHGCTVTMDQPRTVIATFDDLGPATAHLNPPDRRSDPLRVTFDEPVHRLTTSNVVLKPKGGHAVAASLRCFNGNGDRTSCATGQVRRATLVPRAPLDRGKTYLALADPAGVAPIVDRVRNPVALVKATFSI